LQLQSHQYQLELYLLDFGKVNIKSYNLRCSYWQVTCHTFLFSKDHDWRLIMRSPGPRMASSGIQEVKHEKIVGCQQREGGSTTEMKLPGTSLTCLNLLLMTHAGRGSRSEHIQLCFWLCYCFSRVK